MKEKLLLDLQGQCFKYEATPEKGFTIKENIMVKVIRQSGNRVYCICIAECADYKTIGSCILDVENDDEENTFGGVLSEYIPMTKEEFDSYYIPIKKEVEGAMQEAEFV